MYKVYGIKNCNTVKKALNHLDSSKITYEFIDFKKNSPKKEWLKLWKDAFEDWPVNTKGPTYRKIKEDFLEAKAPQKYALLIENSSAIKRPILEKANKVICFGYDEDVYNKLK